PMTDELEPDTAALVEHVEWLLDEGCDGVAVLGTTGEANSLSVEQRLRVIEAAGARLPTERLMIGTGSTAIGEALRLSRAALDAGIFNLLVLPPFYYKPVSDEGLYRFFAGLIDGLGEPRVRVYLYNFPQLTGINFSLELINRLRVDFPEQVVGIKDSSGNWDNMRAVAESFPGFGTFAGTERYLLDMLRAGGAGCISATANSTSMLCQHVYAAWRDGSPNADERQEKLTGWRMALQSVPGIPALKALAAGRTGREGWRNMLPPMVPLSADQELELMGKLTDLGFFDNIGARREPARAAGD
ncbi:MAG TPA: dihydrodipicolinate synthase family protein, partial [Geminicoccaceae bacterium]|nr:dihydrodipicolinate synthase family protein [Geminicoccaceae bacterium]